jgi:putative lipoprotein
LSVLSAFVTLLAAHADPPAAPSPCAAAQQGCVITGTANYAASFTIGSRAVFEATLEDVSVADAPAQRIGSAIVRSPGAGPLHFTIAYDPQMIDSTHRYAVRARIKDGDRVLFATQTSYPVLADPSSTAVDIELREVASASDPVGAVAAASDATLEDTYWKLIRVGTVKVTSPRGAHEIHFMLAPDEARASGFAGCNTFTGSYTLDGEHLLFGNLASTMMACPNGMDIEQALLQALGATATWRISGRTLELIDPSSTVVAAFEAREAN